MTPFHRLLSNPAAETLGWTLLHFVWQGAAVAVAVALGLLILRKRSPTVRYMLACSALAVMAALPVATYRALAATDSDSSRSTSPALPATLQTVNDGTAQISTRDAADISVGTAAVPGPSLSGWHQTLERVLEPTAPWLALGWMLGVMALSLRLLGGWIHIERLKRRMVSPLTGEWQVRLDRAARSLGVEKVVRLLQSGLAEAPVVIGWLRPVILLPTSALIGLTPEQLEAVLAHELAHVRRSDYLVNLLQMLVEVALFYHPAVWWVSRQIRIEREHACDDLAAAVHGDSLRYAHALAELARICAAAPTLAAAATGGSLLSRIRRLLTVAPVAERPAYAEAWPGGVATAIGALAMVVVVNLTGYAASRAVVAPAPIRLAQNEAPAPPAPLSAHPAARVVEQPPSSSAPLGVAIIEFRVVGGDAALADALYELVSQRLSEAPGIRLVERDRLTSAMKEVHLSQTGLVDPATATRLGNIVGARIFVVLKLMQTGGDWLCTPRLIDTQTSEVKALRVAGRVDEGIVAFADRTADELTQRLAAWSAPHTAPAEEAPWAREIAALRARLTGKTLPRVAIRIPESHVGTWVPDPAGETEMISVLTQVGFPVVDIKTLMKPESDSWWLRFFRGRNDEDPGVRAQITGGAQPGSQIVNAKELDKVREKADLFIVGEAFSENGGQNYGLRSCAARVEAKAIDTKSEVVAASGSEHAVAADISEQIAGKKALRQGGGRLAIALAGQLADYWEKAQPKAAPAPAPAR